MVRWCGIWMMVLALVATTGGHWMILQMCAWTGMVARFAQEGSLVEAISKTLDGKHPCKLCRVVRDGRAEESKSGKTSVVAPARLELLMSKPGPAVAAIDSVGRLMVFGFLSACCEDRWSPPVPPPRAV